MTREIFYFLNPPGANPTKWSNTLKQFIDNLPTNFFGVFDHFVGLALKGLKSSLLFNSFYCRFLFVNKTLQLNNFKNRPDMNKKISIFVICVEAIMYL